MRRLSIGLPLLAKELVEQSSRRRTYVVRVVYAILLFVAAFFSFYDILGSSQNDLFGVLGNGKKIFEFVVAVQFFGIYLFMPAIACGVLTTEKERNSLGLLFLTRLGPSTILMEKLLSRLVPMLTFLLLSLPLLAFAYSLGGITTNYLWSGVWVLALTMFQMCSLAVMCSAIFRRTVGAFIASYLIGLVVLFALPVAHEFRLLDFQPMGVVGPTTFGQTVILEAPVQSILTWAGIIGGGSQDIPLAFFGPHIFYEYGSQGLTFPTMVLRSVPMMFSCVVFLVVARLFIVRRAFAPARNYLIGLFQIIDRMFTRMNQNSVTKGIVLIRESTALPGDAPVAWRETTKKSLGTVRYLFRVLVATELPVVAVCILMVGADVNRLEGVSVMLFLLWFLAVMLVSVKAASLVSGERSHQTLDVLLTTPLSAREIVLQKYRGVRRLMYVLAVPFISIFLFEAAWRGAVSGYSYGYRHSEFSVVLYLTASLLSIAIYLPMVAWLSFLVGMLLRTQARAIIASLGIIVVWCVAPVCFLVFANEVFLPGYAQYGAFRILLISSPATIIPINEFNDYREVGDSAWSAVTINFLLYGTCLFAFRLLCLRLANRLLGRGDD